MSLPASLDIQAADSGDGLPAFKLTANTGEPMRLDGFRDPVVVDLAGASFSAQTTPVILDHDPGQRFGHTTSTQIDGAAITASGLVSSATQQAKDIVADLKNGFPFQVSIGANIRRAERVKAGETATVNGRTISGPVIISRETPIHEISLAVLGADPRTSVQLAASRASDMDDDLKAYIETFGLDADTLEPEQITKFQASFAQQQQQTARSQATATATLADDRRAVAAEEARIDGIKAAFRKPEYAEVTTVELGGGRKVELRAFKQLAFEDTSNTGEPTWSPEAVELVLMRAARPRPSGATIHSRSAGPINGKALACAMARACGVPDKATVHAGTWYAFDRGLETYYDEQTLEASRDPNVTRHASLHGFMGAVIEAAGLYYSGDRKDNDFARTYRQARTRLANLDVQAAGFSTLEANNVLEDAANKAMLNAYQASEVVWPQIARTVSLNDFKVHNMYRLEVGGAYAEIGADGELRHGKLSDQKETLQGSTYGILVQLDRKHIINDDLMAFMQIPMGLGRLAALKIEEAIFKLLLGNAGSFFSAGNNNNETGAGSDLTIDGLTAAEQAFGDFVDSNNLPILVRPDRILVGTQDQVTANKLFSDTEIR
ncbi:MAG: hypothetical protein GTO31_12480, partial [Xanthomonadales bacterium]|nr:hypothetical protein [Xanthomonadales bacterium]